MPKVSTAKIPEVPPKSPESLSKKELLLLVREQAKQIEEQTKQIALLIAEVTELKRRVNMNSSNSSKPSSTDGYKKPNKDRSLRGKSDKRRGGQEGHKGATLLPVETPDTIEILDVVICSGCGESLLSTPMTRIQKRQVLDIPEPTFLVHEYQGGEKKCPGCRVVTASVFPNGITAPIQYGPNIKTHSCYLYNYGIVSFERIQEFWNEIFGLDISQTSLMKFNEEGYGKLDIVTDCIKKALGLSRVLHNDETGVHVGKDLSWIHVASTKFLTTYLVHAKRGGEALKAMGILEGFMGKLIHDHWKSYFSFEECMHILCNAHHLRELIAVIENEKVVWAGEMKAFLLRVKGLKDQAISRGEDCLSTKTLKQIHKEYSKIIKKGLLEHTKSVGVVRKPGQRGRLKKSKGHNLLVRFRDYEQANLEFLHDFEVPFDNNLAERDIRPVKIRTKISGCFRSFEGAEWFCRIRGYISTMRKQGFPIYQAMKSMFEGEVLSPRFECV